MTASEKPSKNVSKFYLACRNGDVEFVKEHLKKTAGKSHELNQLEPTVRSTPLHAACYYGHKEIVQLLIEHGCDRSETNAYGVTAYEEAANDEIRQLFRRPSTASGVGRFQDDTNDDTFEFVKRPREDKTTTAADTEPKKPKTATVQGYKTETEKQTEIGYATTSIAMCQSKLGRFIADKLQHESPMSLRTMVNNLRAIIDQELVARDDPESQKALELLNEFVNHGPNDGVKYLIRLYTLETKFYRTLKQNPIPLALPLYIAVQTMNDRHYQGKSYRGARMTDDEVATYQWATNNRGSLLQTKHFSSTSITRSIAEDFATQANAKSHEAQSYSVLFIFDFPKKCDQAINLSRISETQPGLSEYENEAEVLILPWTLFQVDSVEKEEEASSYTIHLTNFLLPHASFWSAMKWTLTHPVGSLERFRQYFPDKKRDKHGKKVSADVSNVVDKV